MPDTVDALDVVDVIKASGPYGARPRTSTVTFKELSPTQSGLRVLNQLGHLPANGESFDHQGWRFEVVDLDGRRIDRILARRIAAGGRRAAV
jgi:hypothetical protein